LTKVWDLDVIDVETNSGIAVLKMRHGKVNAMDLEFCQALISELRKLKTGDCRAAILTGNDRVFSAGVDLVRLVREEPVYLETFLPVLIECFQTIFQFPKPLVAAINGHAIAGGCILASACDYRVAHSKVRIGIPELRVGVPLPSIAIEIIRFAVATEALQAMVNVGRNYRGDEAVQVGLADQIVASEEVLDSAMAAAKEFLTIPPSVFFISKKQLRAPANRNVHSNEKEFESLVFELWHSDEIQDVIKKYVAERL
jgi:enoyl-CoA hydratase